MRTASKPAKNEKWGKAGARRLRVGAAIAILATAACVDDAASGKETRNGGEKPHTATANRAAPGIEIAALEGTLPTEANLFAGFLQEETSRAALPGNTSLELAGALGKGEQPDGTYMVAVIDIENGKGERLHRVVSETLLPEDERSSHASEGLRRFAVATARKISQWYAASSGAPQKTLVRTAPSEGDRIVTGSIAPSTPPSRPFEIEISPAPGDGTVSLTQALDKALTMHIGTAPRFGMQGFRVEGRVVAASRADGRTDLWIDWTVKSAKGGILGEIHQKNELAAERIAGRWGEVAETAAEAAAQAVLAIVEPGPGPAPGPMAANS